MRRLWALVVLLLALLPGVAHAQGLNSDGLHDPSTPIRCAGRWWVYATGNGIVARSSPDLVHWTSEPNIFTTLPGSLQAAVPNNRNCNIWAPEVKFLNGEYNLYYAVSTWGSRVSAIGLATSRTLDPKSPRYHWTDRGVVVRTSSSDSYNAIDPSVLKDPSGRLWLSFGSFFSGIKLIQLDPKTGGALAGAAVVSLANNGEASYLYFHQGWYYLFCNWGTCCRGPSSTYNIRMGRARSVVGPYLDRYGVDMAHGGGSLFLGSQGGRIGPGQIGIFRAHGHDDFSCHDEWDTAYNGGRGSGAVLNIRPLLWRDGWPSAGPLGVAAKPGSSYLLLNKRSGCVAETQNNLTADNTLVQQWFSWSGPGQRWTLTPEAGGDYEILGVGSGKALTRQGTGLVIAPFQDAPTQLWRVTRGGDGFYTVFSKQDGLALTAEGFHEGAHLGVAPDQHLDTQKWLCLVP